ncbi:hypothetical protein T01_5332 [Trichinella spiralis]|uniref:Uncharacterized protein n=1 Tax=Trichinella spiralis TaxID=6334 RepID=A0A0V1AR08_TRISP|nr:hypothetical protein T01_9614 [Trichinella spiralis]KRY27071.1 hypothetical protein T01_5332 [Trichinella spiralis]
MTRCCWDMRHLAQIRRGTALRIPSRYALKHSHEIFGQSTVVDPKYKIIQRDAGWQSLARRTPKPLRRKVSDTWKCLRQCTKTDMTSEAEASEEQQQRRISAKRRFEDLRNRMLNGR